MKRSSVLHCISTIAAIFGALALIGVWIGAETLLGTSQEQLFDNAKTLLLVSVAFGIGTLIHLKKEKQK